LFDRLRIGALGGAFGGGAIAFTLMACYGMAPCDDGTQNCHDFNTDGGDSTDASRDAKRPDVQVGDPSTDAGGGNDARSDANADSDGGDVDAGDGG
jgi:hypothetical protein